MFAVQRLIIGIYVGKVEKVLARVLSRLRPQRNRCPKEKVESELEYLNIAISKTAGEREVEAWGWLMAKVEAWREAAE